MRLKLKVEEITGETLDKILPPGCLLRVRIVRLAPRRYRLLADADLREALRHVQAGVSDALEIPPDSADVTWFYDQERNRTYSVRVEFYADGEQMQSAVIQGAQP